MDQFGTFLLSYLTAILLVTFITDSISSRVLRRVGPGVFASLVGVFVGSGITFAWDIWKTSRDQHTELLRAARSVDHETQTNLGIITNDLFALTNDDVQADMHSEVITPAVAPLLTSAGETAYLKGSFELYSSNFSISVGDIYTINYLINKRIEARDFYRFTNQAMDNYETRRKMLNNELEGILRQQEDRLKQLHSELIKLIKQPNNNEGREAQL